MTEHRRPDHHQPAEPVQLSPATLAALPSVTWPAGAVLFHAGDPDDQLYLLLEGEVALVEGMGTPWERTASVRGPGGLLGELSFFQRDRQHRFTASARSDARLLTLPRSDVDGIVRREPSLAYELLRAAGAHLRRTHHHSARALELKDQALVAANDALARATAQLAAQERLQRELDLARAIQEQMLPAALPATESFGLAAWIAPAYEVGGDFYDVFWLDDATLGLVIGDVCGKGMPAALYMAQMRSLIRAAATLGLSPEATLRQVNAHVLALTVGTMFATVVYATLAVASGDLTVARAGHEYPLLLTASGCAAVGTPAAGQPLGLLPDPAIDVHRRTLGPGETLLLYTDGVTDTLDPQGAAFGLERLRDALRAGARQGAEATRHAVLQALRAFQGPAAQTDDVALLVVHAAP